ncbi:hypothetical protein EIP91_010888 [Steccherinum ochraceum]|uniref:BTB domain-containing protein n=1 Tax=Steccherinum ochraceum TaxID=92696 RepID=A0A4R0RSC0_9APHY|nr:hypothetical protein EIP91_010888 [Steccherinum ochraceum]
MTDSRPAKRSRSDIAYEPSINYERSKDFWFADGNVVLVAQNTAFRLHQGVLGRKSAIFQDMFAIPQPEDADIYEGCPKVELSDAAEDIEEMLAVLYDGDSLLNTFDTKLKRPAVISAWLRLGTKYQLDLLRDEAMKKLAQRYPETLKDYDAWVTQSNPSDESRWSQERGDIIAVNLARKFDLHGLLPAAFLACSQLSIKRLVVDPEHTGPDYEDLTILSFADLRRCLSGREQLHDFYMSRYHFPPTCRSSASCESTIKVLKEEAWDELFEEYLQTPLRSFEWAEHTALCSACVRSFSISDLEERERMWGLLKSIFKLNVERG